MEVELKCALIKLGALSAHLDGGVKKQGLFAIRLEQQHWVLIYFLISKP